MRNGLTICPTEKPATRRFLLKCRAKGCKSTLAFDCPTKQETRWTRGFVGIPGSALSFQVTVPNRLHLPEVYCATHRHPLSANEVKGTVTECPCDGRCTSAKGPNCDCSCGGANHGSDYL